MYFTWGIVSIAARYAAVIDKLKEYVALHFRVQATVAAWEMEELKAPTCVKSDRPIQVYWADEEHTRAINNRRNAGATKDTVPKFEDWEYKLKVEEYLKNYKFYKEGTKAWAENKDKWYHFIP